MLLPTKCCPSRSPIMLLPPPLLILIDCCIFKFHSHCQIGLAGRPSMYISFGDINTRQLYFYIFLIWANSGKRGWLHIESDFRWRSVCNDMHAMYIYTVVAQFIHHLRIIMQQKAKITVYCKTCKSMPIYTFPSCIFLIPEGIQSSAIGLTCVTHRSKLNSEDGRRVQECVAICIATFAL